MDDERFVDLRDRGVDRVRARANRRRPTISLGQGVGVEGDPRLEGHAAERGAGVGDDPLDGVAVAADGQRLGDHRVDVRRRARSSA